ncbi:MAG: hypothetical protein DIU84_08755, partial [Bacillota bacterium]
MCTWRCSAWAGSAARARGRNPSAAWSSCRTSGRRGCAAPTVRASPDDRAARLQAGAGALGVRLDAGGAARLVAYLDLLYQANRTLNLTRVAPDAALELHGVDSLAGLRVLADPELLVADVGTGGGFPGVALAAARPAWRGAGGGFGEEKGEVRGGGGPAAGAAHRAPGWGPGGGPGRPAG